MELNVSIYAGEGNKTGKEFLFPKEGQEQDKEKKKLAPLDSKTGFNILIADDSAGRGFSAKLTSS